jgi:hypothetical protein
MPAVAYKKTTVTVIGIGRTYSCILNILAASGVHYIAGANIHFVSSFQAVVDGYRVVSDYFLIINSPAVMRTNPAAVRQNSASYSNEVGGDILLVGASDSEIDIALTQDQKHRFVVATSEESILPSHDMAVQEVLTRYLHKQGVAVYTAYNVLPTVRSTSNTLETIIEKSGSPKKILSTAVYEHKIPKPTDIGTANISSVVALPDTCSIVRKLAPHITKINDTNTTYPLSQLRTIVEFALSTRKKTLLVTPSQISGGGGLKYFTLGEPEQKYYSTNLGYKRSIVPIRSEVEYRCFLKVITSLSGVIIGISGVIEEGMIDPSMFANLISSGAKSTELMDVVDSKNKLAKTVIEVCKELRV